MANFPRSKCRLSLASKPKAKEPIQIDWGTKDVKAVKGFILEKPHVAVSDMKWVQPVTPKACIPRSKKQFIPKATGLPTRKVVGESGEPGMGRSVAEDDSYVKVNVEDYYPVTPSVRKANVVQQFPPASAPVPTTPNPTQTLPSVESPRPCILCILRVAQGAPCGHQGQPGGPPAEIVADAQVVKGTKALPKVSAPPVQAPLKSSIGVGTDNPIVPPPKVMVDASVQAVGTPAGDDEVDSEMTEEERKKAIKRMISILQASLEGDEPALDIGEERFVLDFLRAGAHLLSLVIRFIEAHIAFRFVYLPSALFPLSPVKPSHTPASPSPSPPPPRSTSPPPPTRLVLPRVRTSLVRPHPLESATKDHSIPSSSSKGSAKAPVDLAKGVGRDPTPITKPSRSIIPVLSPGAEVAARATTQSEINKTRGQIKASGIPLRSQSGRGIRQLEVRKSDAQKQPELHRRTGSGLKSTTDARPTSQQGLTANRSPTASRNVGVGGSVQLRATTRKWADPVINQTRSNASNAAPVVDFNHLRSNLRRVSPSQGKENNTAASSNKAAPAPYRRALRPVNGPKIGSA
ncbi:hypothetical protein NLI96_g10759 [Meripilus lineatus]|uniref:Uncharacterized protein n=1 Tax=Meripilus lineatus TaxID=2056292 RepID=A0AAD5Y9T4_9APHY|nr:hypothetical protein NLI96_g10759 [Physisporinus lineatus]